MRESGNLVLLRTLRKRAEICCSDLSTIYLRSRYLRLQPQPDFLSPPHPPSLLIPLILPSPFTTESSMQVGLKCALSDAHMDSTQPNSQRQVAISVSAVP